MTLGLVTFMMVIVTKELSIIIKEISPSYYNFIADVLTIEQLQLPFNNVEL